MNPPLDSAGMEDPVRLNLGAGDNPIEGFANLDGRSGDSVYPLRYPDESVEEIRASHVLEHFSYREVGDVVAEWARVLKFGGVMKIAVPDFGKLASAYRAGRTQGIQPFVMGGQTHDLDYHKAIFDTPTLVELMRGAGGLRSIQRFEGSGSDCSGYPISLNLAGIKRRALTTDDIAELNIGAVMSVPRLGFMDNYFSAYETIGPLGIEIQKQTGAFWGQSIERGFDEYLEAGKKWILAIDYDSIWTMNNLRDLLQLARDFPNADAIAPVQVHRTQERPLVTMENERGEKVTSAPAATFIPELSRLWGAHFGLTMIRAEALSGLPRPWFQGRPDASGRWSAQRVDDDVSFWEKWNDQGFKLYLANHVSIGHCELMIRWPSEDLKPVYQHPADFWSNGPPDTVWR